MGYQDPTTVRLSDQFLLSDFLLCDSVVRYGYSNQFDTDDNNKMAEAFRLAATLEYLIEQVGVLNISYGYISPELSKNIVKYQDPNKPSYHRFDIGAAVDIRFPNALCQVAPIQIAWSIDAMAEAGDIQYSRMITYSESEWICFATAFTEKVQRKAFYENRYIVGQRKPQFVTYPQKNRQAYIDRQPIPDDWRGQGYPSYHGNGRLQLHHMPLSTYSTYLDFLYNKKKVHKGERNLPPFIATKEIMDRWKVCATNAAEVIDRLVSKYQKRFSIVSAYDSNESDGKCNWQNSMRMTIMPPESLHADDVQHELITNCSDIVCRVFSTPSGAIRIEGHNL